MHGWQEKQMIALSEVIIYYKILPAHFISRFWEDDVSVSDAKFLLKENYQSHISRFLIFQIFEHEFSFV